MTREEAQSVIMTEQKCVDRAGTDRCNRDCANCDLVMDDAVINEAYNMAIKALEQPEIIRCKDCKYRMPYDWMFSEVRKSQNMDDYSDNEMGCLYCDMSMAADDFCSRAERRITN